MSAVSVVVPTFNEAANVSELLRRLDAALLGRHAEVVLVDDGDDDLPSMARTIGQGLALDVRVIRRVEPVGRLGGAVVHGINESAHDLVVVCDGDLQHPPELVPVLVDQLARHDLAVASRYAPGGDSRGLATGLRKIVSRATGRLTKLIFPVRLRGCADPMSGFFAIRKSAVDLGALRPRGFKILLEIVGRSRPMTLTEVPFTFAERAAGESHATLSEGVRFLRQLAALRITSSRMMLFTLVGLSGVIPNLATLAVLTGAGVHYLPAAVLAVQAGVLWNFAGAELLVWRDARAGRLRRRFLRYVAVGETDLLRVPFVALLVSGLGMSSILATLVTMLAAFMLRFSLADKIVYRRGAPTTALDLAVLAPQPVVEKPTG